MNNAQPIWIRWLELTAIIFSVITGATASGLIIFKGGALVHEVNSHEVRITNIEARGSPPISEHMKLDDERELRTRERLAKVEEAVMAFQSMRVDMAKLSADVASISRSVDKITVDKK